MAFVTLADTRCAKCGIVFGVPGDFLDCRRQDKGGFYCPNGHCMSYTQSEAEKLRLERDRLKQQVAQRDDELLQKDREIIAAKGQITKLRKRAAAGTCPCCQRTFSNMAAHMKTKHPDFKAEPPVLKVVA